MRILIIIYSYDIHTLSQVTHILKLRTELGCRRSKFAVSASGRARIINTCNQNDVRENGTLELHSLLFALTM